MTKKQNKHRDHATGKRAVVKNKPDSSTFAARTSQGHISRRKPGNYLSPGSRSIASRPSGHALMRSAMTSSLALRVRFWLPPLAFWGRK